MKRILLIVIFIILPISQVNAQVAVIANKSVQANEITSSELKDIIALDKTTWSDGSAIVVFELKPSGDTKTKFYSHIGSSAKKMKKAWMKKMLAGDAQAPESLGSEDEVVNKVASTPGAIGYVSSAKTGDNVKTLATIK